MVRCLRQRVLWKCLSRSAWTSTVTRSGSSRRPLGLRVWLERSSGATRSLLSSIPHTPGPSGSSSASSAGVPGSGVSLCLATRTGANRNRSETFGNYPRWGSSLNYPFRFPETPGRGGPSSGGGDPAGSFVVVGWCRRPASPLTHLSYAVRAGVAVAGIRISRRTSSSGRKMRSRREGLPELAASTLTGCELRSIVPPAVPPNVVPYVHSGRLVRPLLGLLKRTSPDEEGQRLVPALGTGNVLRGYRCQGPFRNANRR